MVDSSILVIVGATPTSASVAEEEVAVHPPPHEGASAAEATTKGLECEGRGRSAAPVARVASAGEKESERVQEDSRAAVSDISEDVLAMAVEVASAVVVASSRGVVVVCGNVVSAELAETGVQPSMF